MDVIREPMTISSMFELRKCFKVLLKARSAPEKVMITVCLAPSWIRNDAAVGRAS
ncbi:hypothetical protein KIN20_007315 [Parelaphostrongylus tenuis]|uniref:Uncharacterized protein n=1 Tax=Parelaphostrongylus tenuis TaxID=148309 RepID=A0AAD5MVC5_PARTN|nr:hypothetical protein KIN20_007315 [Parelaphostrongylus tenuis]